MMTMLVRIIAALAISGAILFATIEASQFGYMMGREDAKFSSEPSR